MENTFCPAMRGRIQDRPAQAEVLPGLPRVLAQLALPWVRACGEDALGALASSSFLPPEAAKLVGMSSWAGMMPMFCCIF